jgi:hypothetical protein
VCSSWHNLPAKVFEDGGHGFAMLWAAAWQGVHQLAGPNARQYRIVFGMTEIIGHPVHGLMCKFAEFLGGQTAILLRPRLWPAFC